jgi:hypothetical protein
MLVGPRQVGKTTLVETLCQRHSKAHEVITFHGEYHEDAQLLNSLEFGRITAAIGNRKWIVIDEGQKIPRIGDALKILIDHYKHTRHIVVTGSSSLHLLSQTAESLAGRKRVFTLYPLSYYELSQHHGVHETHRQLETHLLYGSYPAVVNAPNLHEKRQELLDLSSSALYKDILEFQDVRNPAVLSNLLRILALQIGQEVSFSSLAQELGMNSRTVERYIDLLEKNFILFRLPPFYSNRMKEISKMQKIYFVDLGIRNALLNQFNPLEQRTDKGQIWENYLISERRRQLGYAQSPARTYFWRNKNQQEIDWIEQYDGVLTSYEIKWKERASRPPKAFHTLYPHAQHHSLNKDNYSSFLRT